MWRKNLNFALTSYYVLMIFALIDVATVTWAPVHRELGFSFALLNDSYAAGCGALAVGAIILVPFSLKLGRRPIYVFSTAAQCGLSVWLAKMVNVADLMGPNVLTCLVGALAEVLVQMTVADIYFVHQRGLANTIYYWVMTVGVTLSPLAGGYVTSSQGWRWVWWWMVILLGAGFVAFLFLYEETMFSRPIDGVAVPDANAATHAPDKKDSEFPAALDNTTAEKGPSDVTVVAVDHSIPKKSYWQRLALWSISPISWGQAAKHAYQPFLIMFWFPAIFFMAFEYGALTACSTVPVTTLSAVMVLPPYNFGPEQIGLMGIPPFIGVSLATMVSGPVSDRLALFLARRNHGIFEPEMRLWQALAFAALVPAGLFMFGIGLSNGSHWLLPAFGLGISAFGIVPASSSALTYLTDSYTDVCPVSSMYRRQKLTCLSRLSQTRSLASRSSATSSRRSSSLCRRRGLTGSGWTGSM